MTVPAVARPPFGERPSPCGDHLSMPGHKLRQQIVFEAARLIFQRQEAAFADAKLRAARALCRQRLRPGELPTNREILAELQRLASVYGTTPGFPETASSPAADRFQHYRSLLVPLSRIHQDPKRHPEGDVLYHSLQVFCLCRDGLIYSDEELLLAALLHDVGKGIDRLEPVVAGLKALGNSISERTGWLIENHHSARDYLKGTIGIRARRRLQESDDFDELLLLARSDLQGRVRGAIVPELDDALAWLRALAEADEDGLDR